MPFKQTDWSYVKLPVNYTRKKKPKLPKWVLWFMLIILLSCSLSWLIRYYLVFPANLLDHSMEPNLPLGSRIFFRKTFRDISRGDIAYIWSKKRGLNIVCRILGLPEENIEINDQKIFINSKELKTNYPITLNETNVPGTILSRDHQEAQVIESDHYYCLFDNRKFLNDSRSWGTFAKNEIIGIAYSKGILGAALSE